MVAIVGGRADVVARAHGASVLAPRSSDGRVQVAPHSVHRASSGFIVSSARVTSIRGVKFRSTSFGCVADVYIVGVIEMRRTGTSPTAWNE